MRVLVTGGSGYIGAHVCRLLRDRGDHVVVVDDFVTGVRERVAEFAQLELSLAAPGAADRLAAFAAEHQVDAVVHLAGRKQVAESVAKPLTYWNDNVVGLAVVLEACQRVGVARFLFSSSAAVYGDASGHVTEADPCRPVNPYGASKLAGEWLTADVARASTGSTTRTDTDTGTATPLRATSLRYFNVAGAGWPELADTAVLNLVPMVIERLAVGDAPRIFGDDYPTVDGTCVRDFIHVLDLAEAHLAALDALETAPPGSHRVFNVGTGVGGSVRAVVEGLRARWPHATPAPVVEPRRAGDPAEVVADPSRIAEALGWRATRTLDDILDSVIAARGQ